jgi:hypothetical protein
MKYFVLLVALMMSFMNYAVANRPSVLDSPNTDLPPEAAKAVQLAAKVNLVISDLAICQGYYIHMDDTAGTERFSQYGSLMIILSQSVFADMGVAFVGDDPHDIYNEKVDYAKNEMPNAEPVELVALSSECERLDAHMMESFQSLEQ